MVPVRPEVPKPPWVSLPEPFTTTNDVDDPPLIEPVLSINKSLLPRLTVPLVKVNTPSTVVLPPSVLLDEPLMVKPV